MATTTHHTRKRPSRPVAHRTQPIRHAGWGVSLARAATSRPAKAAYVAIGTIGLAALAVALLGPKRLEREVFKPLKASVGPQAEKLWDQARPVREQLTGLFHKAGAEREKLARDFQSWIGHFRAG